MITKLKKFSPVLLFKFHGSHGNFLSRRIHLKKYLFKTFCEKKPVIELENNENLPAKINDDNEKNLAENNPSGQQLCIGSSSSSLIDNIPKYVPKPETPLNLFDTHSMQVKNSAFGDSFETFAWKNNANYNEKTKNIGEVFFRKSNVKLVHYLDDRNINDFRKGIQENNYDFYDVYRDIPEFIFLGRSNVGKSSLLNKIFFKEIAKENKRAGRTQKLEFYIFGQEGKNKTIYKPKSIYSKMKIEHWNPSGIAIDAPGFGWVDGPVMLRKKFKYLVYTYLNYAVRLREIIYLINGQYGMTPMDREELEFINQFGKEIQLVFTKVDNTNDKKIIKYLSETSNFSRDLKYVRTEILLTSCKTGYGLENLRAHLYLDVKEMEDKKTSKHLKEDLLYLENVNKGKIGLEAESSLIENK